MKRFFSVLLCTLLLLGIIPTFPASADDHEHIDVSSIPDGGKYTDAKGNDYTVLIKFDKTLVVLDCTNNCNLLANY